MIPPYHAALERIAALEAPVVAAVRGAIAGGGLGLAWCSDIVIASEDAVFATGFAKLGLSGDGGSSWWLPRLCTYPWRPGRNSRALGCGSCCPHSAPRRAGGRWQG